MQAVLNQPFTNVQLELLKTFSHQLPENDLIDLKQTLVTFFSERLVKQANAVWENEKWNNEKVDEMLVTKMRISK